MPWNQFIDLLNMIDVSQMVAGSARLRKETRGAHFRSDFPDQNDDDFLSNIFIKMGMDGVPEFDERPVAFIYKSLKECQQYSK